MSNQLLNILVNIEGAERVSSLLGEIGQTAIDTAVKTDRMNQMMKAASGSMSQASQNMDFVKSIAQSMGTEIYASADAYAKLTAATRSTSLEGEQTRKMFEALSAANTKMGGSTADLTGMINAFSQMISKGTVSMEELRGQLGERLPGAMKLAADSMGITTQALIDQISQGQILAEDLLPRLSDAINNTYNDGKFDTAQANINRLYNEWELFKQSIIDSNAINAAITGTLSLLKNVRAEFAFNRELFSGDYSTKAYRIGEAASRELYGVEKDPRIEAFKEFRKQQEEYTKAQQRITAIESEPRKMGDTDRLALLEKERDKLKSITQAYVNASDAYRKFDVDAREANKQKNELGNVQPEYVKGAKAFLIEHEVDKIKKFTQQRDQILESERKSYERYLEKYKSDEKAKAEITETYNQKTLAITKEYQEKIDAEQKRRDAPGIRAAKRIEREDDREARAAQREAEKLEREKQAMMERSRDLTQKYENDIRQHRADTLNDSIQKIRDHAAADIQAAEYALKDKKLIGEEYTKNEKLLAELRVSINEKAEADIVKLKENAVNKIIDYENGLQMDIAKSNNDKLTEIRLVYEAEIKANKDKYDQQVKDAKKANIDISNLTRLYNTRDTQLEKRYADDRIRLEGGYMDKLSLKMREKYSNDSSISNEFYENLSNLTITSMDGMANAFVDFAATGKATWQEFAYSVILEIEKMIAKMLVMYAVQKLIGMAGPALGGTIGGEIGGNISQATGGSPFNGSGMFSSFANTSANGNAFMDGELIPFADGGIVNRPTMFPMKNGTGLMGEAGPEAIMPLSRDSNGKLGIRSNSEKTGNAISIGGITVMVQSDSKNPEQQGKIIGSAIERQIKQLIQMEVKDSFRPGNAMNRNRTIGGGVIQYQ